MVTRCVARARHGNESQLRGAPAAALVAASDLLRAAGQRTARVSAAVTSFLTRRRCCWWRCCCWCSCPDDEGEQQQRCHRPEITAAACAPQPPSEGGGARCTIPSIPEAILFTWIMHAVSKIQISQSALLFHARARGRRVGQLEAPAGKCCWRCSRRVQSAISGI